VEVDEVDGAVSAVTQEIREVGQRGGGAAVRHAGGTQQRAARERLYVALICGDGGRDGHACGLPVVAGVGFVEAEERVRAVILDAVLCVGGPDRGQGGGVVVEERDEG
jgi:hypothetical protein